MINLPRTVTTIALTALTGAWSPQGQRNTTASPSQPDQFVMMSLKKAGVAPLQQSIQVLFGVAADPNDYAGSVFISQSGCTAVLVGPEVLLSAAHCFPLDRKQTILFDSVDGANHTAECSTYEHYDSQQRIGDFALCKVNGSVTEVTYETISYDRRYVAAGSELLLAGWGRTLTAAPHHQFTTGLAVVSHGPSTQPGGSNAVTTLGVGLAEGDSGGAAFKVLSAAQNSRVVVAVNSERDAYGNLHRSRLSSLSRYAKDYIADWSSKHGNPQICTTENLFNHCHR